MLRFISARDHSLMRRANNWRAPRWIRVWALGATWAGDGWLWGLIGLLILVFGDAGRLTALSAAGLAAILSIVLFNGLKRVAGRKRPCDVAPHCWATLLPPDQFSFPSGHTMTAFAVTVALTEFYPSLVSGLMFCAVSIAISRILLGMHYLSDVIAGAIVGAGLGYLATLLFV